MPKKKVKASFAPSAEALDYLLREFHDTFLIYIGSTL